MKKLVFTILLIISTNCMADTKIYCTYDPYTQISACHEQVNEEVFN